jgi:vacuolar protein sorting-associated protein 13A/C
MAKHSYLKWESLVGQMYCCFLPDSAPLLTLTFLSKVFGLEAPAAEAEMVIPSVKQKNEEYHFGLSWTEGLGKYKLTKVITISPRFLLKNDLPCAIQFREYKGGPRGRAVLDPGERSPLQIIRTGEEKLLTIAYTGLNVRW